MNRLSGQLLCGPLLCLLAACGSTPIAPGANNQALLQSLRQWSFSGKVAIETDRSADSARLHWRQNGADLRLEIAGPGGFRQMIVERKQGQLRLYRDRQWQTLDATDTSLPGAPGWPLPLATLPWWLRGLPAPGPIAGRSDTAAGQLLSLRQAGWDIHYPRWQRVGQLQLPAVIHFSRAAVRGKILLKKWTLAP